MSEDQLFFLENVIDDDLAGDGNDELPSEDWYTAINAGYSDGTFVPPTSDDVDFDDFVGFIWPDFDANTEAMLFVLDMEEEDWVDFFGELVQTFDDCAATRVADTTTVLDASICTGEEDDDDNELDADDAAAVLEWLDIRTIACGLQDGDDTLCTEQDDGPLVPWFFFEDREAMGDGDGWDSCFCWDDDDTYDNCEADYNMLDAVYWAAESAEDLEAMGLTEEGVSAMLDEYETNVTYAETLADLAELFGTDEDDTWADLDMDFFELFCDADFDTMLESAGTDFGRDEIDMFSTFLDGFEIEDEDTDDDLGFLSLFGCETDFGTDSFTLFGDISTLLDDALADDGFAWTATCDPSLAAGVAGLEEGSLAGCALCDTTEGILGQIAGFTCSDQATIDLLTPPPPPAPPAPVVEEEEEEEEECDEDDEDAECEEEDDSAHVFILGFSILAIMASLLN